MVIKLLYYLLFRPQNVMVLPLCAGFFYRIHVVCMGIKADKQVHLYTNKNHIT